MLMQGNVQPPEMMESRLAMLKSYRLGEEYFRRATRIIEVNRRVVSGALTIIFIMQFYRIFGALKKARSFLLDLGSTLQARHGRISTAQSRMLYKTIMRFSTHPKSDKTAPTFWFCSLTSKRSAFCTYEDKNAWHFKHLSVTF